MRIAMVTNSSYPYDPRVRREAEALASAGHEIDVICLRYASDPLYSVINSVRVYRTPVEHRRSNTFGYVLEYFIFFLLAFLYLSYLSIRRRYTIVHVHNMPNILVFITIIPRLLDAKLVLDMHDPMPEVYRSHYKVSEKHWINRLLDFEERISCSYVDFLITVNEPMRVRLLQRGIEPNRVEVIMNLPDTNIFSNQKHHSNVLVERKKEFKLLYTGLISPRNGLDVAIDAINILRDEMPDLCLIIVGDGPHLSALMSCTRKYDLDDRVIFKKVMIIDKIPELILNCDVGISPHYDNVFTKLMFSTKVAEYLIMNITVISARTYTMEHYFDDSVLYYFEPGSAINFAQQVRLIRQRTDQVKVKKTAAKEKMQQLSWQEEKVKLIRMMEFWGSV